MTDLGIKSNAEMGRRAGLSGEMIRQYRSGSIPGSDNVPALAKALDVSQEDLLSFIQGEGGEPSVEEQAVSPNAVLVVRDPVTNEIWFSVELLARLRVHKIKDLLGGKGPGRVGIEEIG